MNATTRILLGASGALLSISGAAATLSAQQTLEPVHVTANARADSFHDQAMALPTETRFATKAARLHERSAELRDESDPMAASCLRTAAFLRYYAGGRRASADLMEKAAERAAGIGDVGRAADSYVDAAYIAQELKEGDRARTLARKAELLANSPLITDVQRASIRARIGEPAMVALLAPAAEPGAR
jgi:hypothetical protein